MISLQVLSKVISDKSIAILEDNFLTEEYFPGYEEEYNFIVDHYKKYGNVPDEATFLSQFTDNNGNPTIELVEVNESDRYLVDKIQEEYLFQKSVPIVQKAAKLLGTDANAAAEYMVTAMKEIQPHYSLGGIDIIAQANKRYDEFLERKNMQDKWFITTGFKELDNITHGLQRGEELMVIVARVNQGKSWVLEKICTHIWEIGYNIGYVSPEMGATNIGYRFDTLYNHFSNKDLTWGNKDLQEDSYRGYIEDLKSRDNKFIVATPADFQRTITITKLRNWVRQYKLDVIAIDGISYLTDERAVRGDNKNTMLTNISEDLMGLSIELGIPIIVVTQANRNAVNKDDEDSTPELENVRDSDGIVFNASKVIAIRQLKNSVLRMQIKKQRNGMVGGKLDYAWDIDTGEFTFVPSDRDAEDRESTQEKVNDLKRRYSKKDRKQVF